MVDDAAALVLDAVEAAGPRTGFAGVVVDPVHVRMSVYWKGDLPVGVASAVARAGARVDVVVRPAAHTRDYLLERAHVIVDEGHSAVHRVSVLPTGAGLGVEASRRIDEAALESALGVPVELVFTDAPAELSRRPWPGGTRLSGRDACTAGFAVRSLDSGSHGLLTAGHCDGDAWGEFRNGGRLVGPDEGVANETLDSKLVPVDRAAARIRSGDRTRRVRGQRTNVAGDEVCMSGAGTGAQCGMRIVNVDTFVRLAGATAFTSVVAAEGVAGPGDSGAPVFTITGDGGVEARGTVAAGAGAAAEVYFVDIQTALDAHHAELLT